MFGSLYKTLIDDLMGKNGSLLDNSMANPDDSRKNTLAESLVYDTRGPDKAVKAASDLIDAVSGEPTSGPDNITFHEGYGSAMINSSAASWPGNETLIQCGNVICDPEYCVSNGTTMFCNGTAPEEYELFHLMLNNEMNS